MKHIKDNFLLHLSELETLVSEERFAIRKKKVEYLHDLLARKQVAIDSLITCKNRANIDHKKDEEIERRIEALKENIASNSLLLSEAMAENRRESEATKQGNTRLKSVKGTYGSKGGQVKPKRQVSLNA